MKQWGNAHERSLILEKECDAFAARLQLVDVREEWQFGRWLLRGPWTWAEVASLRGGIYVGGDIDTVVFRGGDPDGNPRGRVYWMATRSYRYASEKAHLGDTAPDEWDEDCARGDIKWHCDHGQITKAQAKSLLRLLNRGDVGRDEFNKAIYEETEDSELCGMGDVTSRRVFMATAVLRRLAHLFACIDMQEASRQWFRRTA